MVCYLLVFGLNFVSIWRSPTWSAFFHFKSTR